MRSIVLWTLGVVLVVWTGVTGWRYYQHQQREAFCLEHFAKTTDETPEFVTTTLRCVDDGFRPPGQP